MMAINSHFVKEDEVRTYDIHGEKIKLRLTPYMFPPSDMGIFFADNATVNPGESVIDIGTGSGLFAILAAKKGGVVTATDVYFKSLEDVPYNLNLNDVDDKVQLVLGEYFASSSTQFDVIFANLPQEIIFPKYANEIGELLTTISGGRDGNKHQLELLDIASDHMHETSRMYLPVYSMTNYKQTLEKMHQTYHVKLLGIHNGPVKDFVSTDIKRYRELNERGIITMYKEKGVWNAFVLFTELRKKSNLRGI